MYRERPSALPGAVLWWSRDLAGDTERRVLPDGCVDLIWVDGALLVAGPDTVAKLYPGRPDASYNGVRFTPGAGPVLLGVRAADLRDLRVPLTDLWPSARVRRLEEQIAEATEQGAALETLTVELWRTRGAPDPRTRSVLALLASGTPVATTAEEVGLGARQLHRHCLDVFGYGPKTLARILRMNRALDLGRSGTPAAEAAAVTGYADQAHLSREVRALAGAPLGVLLRGRPDQSGSVANRSTTVPSGSSTTA
ncbi:helix-turn-helix domain-containing protein [Nocardiopsis ansamitocini]|uniref:AraC family transcriptional regulator n=1 Tax=Nocardiopsis ansamitocini TaxID=1670832 RepID=A0A9W6P9V5_9ACTN|nr:helix-turn-helix domain-containing protein [Nocardiopsis ansamitocini]GLU49815.1 AraC family transcriptional regulator [Nocardiopsis ansamitocini]